MRPSSRIRRCVQKPSIRHVIFHLATVAFAALMLSGCAPSSGNLNANPRNLSFGNVGIGSKSHQTLTLTNTDSTPYTLTKVSSSGGGFYFKSPTLPLTLAVGQSVSFAMTFQPTGVGDVSGSLSITSTKTETPTYQVNSASIPAAPVTTTQSATILMTGAGVPLTPSISTEPAGETVAAGQAATFSVEATGEAPLSYQWRKNGTAISGATLASYMIPAAASSESGSQFTVVVSNSEGSVTSNAATLTVDGSSPGR